jgi:hypothetical protein
MNDQNIGKRNIWIFVKQNFCMAWTKVETYIYLGICILMYVLLLDVVPAVIKKPIFW